MRLQRFKSILIITLALMVCAAFVITAVRHHSKRSTLIRMTEQEHAELSVEFARYCQISIDSETLRIAKLSYIKGSLMYESALFIRMHGVLNPSDIRRLDSNPVSLRNPAKIGWWIQQSESFFEGRYSPSWLDDTLSHSSRSRQDWFELHSSIEEHLGVRDVYLINHRDTNSSTVLILLTFDHNLPAELSKLTAAIPSRRQSDLGFVGNDWRSWTNVAISVMP